MADTATTDWLVEKITEYAKDTKHKYAIALEGAWGSGKTTFLETKVAPELKKQGNQMVRISLFGLKNANELYDKFGAELLHLSEDKGGKGRALARSTAKQVPKVLSSTMSYIGVPLSLNIGMKTVVDLLARKKHVVVFDDVERRSKDCDDESLFGAINDLVENKSAKVILVSNCFKSDKGPLREFDKNIYEKLVWNVYPYDPSPSDLVKDILGDLASIEGKVNILECVSEAAELAGCRNARSMLRAENFIREMCKINALQDRSIALSSREKALIEAIQLALLECEGKLTDELEDWTGNDFLSPEYMEYRNEKKLREKYADFSCIKDYFNPRNQLGVIDLEEGFKNYIIQRYPDSQSTVEMIAVTDTLSDISSLNDKEVQLLIAKFTPLVQQASFSPHLLKEVIYWNCQLNELGFDNLLSTDELIQNCKKVIDQDPGSAVRFFKDSAFILSHASSVMSQVFDLLAEYSESAYLNTYVRTRLEQINYSDNKCGMLLAEILNEAWDGSCKYLLDIKATLIVDTFLSSNADGQLAIGKFFQNLALYGYSLVRESAFEEWLTEIRNYLVSIRNCENMTQLRIKWFVDYINDLLPSSTGESEC